MDIFVKYPNDETLHHYRTGDGEGSDAATFRAVTLGGRTDVRLFDAEGVEFVDRVEEPKEEALPEGAGVEPVGEPEPVAEAVETGVEAEPVADE